MTLSVEQIEVFVLPMTVQQIAPSIRPTRLDMNSLDLWSVALPLTVITLIPQLRSTPWKVGLVVVCPLRPVGPRGQTMSPVNIPLAVLMTVNP